MSGATLADLLVPALARRGGRIEDADGHDFEAPELLERARRSAAALIREGVGRGEPVHVTVDNRPADVAALLAVWLAGAVAVPVHRDAPPAAEEALRRRTVARAAIDAGEIRTVSHQLPPRRCSLDDAALVVFTSGTTGRPKGVVIGHTRFVGKLEVLRRLLELQASDRIVLPLRLTFIFGIWVALLAVLAGAWLTLLPRFSRGGVEAQFAREGVVLATVPTMLRLLLAGDGPAAAPQTILTGGELLPAPLARAIRTAWPGTRLFDLYGLSETGSCDFCLAPIDQPDGFGTIGRPTAGVAFRIVAEDGQVVPDDHWGELQINSPFGMLGYLNDPQLTASAFEGDFFKTGDLAGRDSSGRVRIVGRIKDIIVRGGNKVAPAELEALLQEHPAIESALCAGVPDPLLGEKVHVLVTARQAVGLDALRRWMGARIEPYKMPDALHLVDALPVGPTGKLDRRAVPSIVTGASARAGSPARHSP